MLRPIESGLYAQDTLETRVQFSTVQIVFWEAEKCLAGDEQYVSGAGAVI